MTFSPFPPEQPPNAALRRIKPRPNHWLRNTNFIICILIRGGLDCRHNPLWPTETRQGSTSTASVPQAKTNLRHHHYSGARRFRSAATFEEQNARASDQRACFVLVCCSCEYPRSGGRRKSRSRWMTEKSLDSSRPTGHHDRRLFARGCKGQTTVLVPLDSGVGWGTGVLNMRFAPAGTRTVWH